jgi:hypothetical protein
MMSSTWKELTVPTPTLLPIEDFDGSRPLVAFDVDGVFNRFHPDDTRTTKVFVGPERRLVRTGHGAKFIVDFDPALVAAVAALIAKHDLELGWLTSWGPNVRGLIEQAFDGVLAGGFILKKMPPLYRKVRSAAWKYTGLRDRVAATGQTWVWVDDEAVEMARLDGVFADGETVAGVPGLPVTTLEHPGLTLAQVGEIDQFLTAVTR